MIWGYPGTYPSMTKITRFVTRVPQRIYRTKQYILWGYPGTYPSMTKTTGIGTRVLQSRYRTKQYTLWGYPISYPSMTKTTGLRTPPSNLIGGTCWLPAPPSPTPRDLAEIRQKRLKSTFFNSKTCTR